MLTDQDLQKIGLLIEAKTKPQFTKINRKLDKITDYLDRRLIDTEIRC